MKRCSFCFFELVRVLTKVLNCTELYNKWSLSPVSCNCFQTSKNSGEYQTKKFEEILYRVFQFWLILNCILITFDSEITCPPLLREV